MSTRTNAAWPALLLAAAVSAGSAASGPPKEEALPLYVGKQSLLHLSRGGSHGRRVHRRGRGGARTVLRGALPAGSAPHRVPLGRDGAAAREPAVPRLSRDRRRGGAPLAGADVPDRGRRAVRGVPRSPKRSRAGDAERRTRSTRCVEAERRIAHDLAARGALRLVPHAAAVAPRGSGCRLSPSRGGPALQEPGESRRLPLGRSSLRRLRAERQPRHRGSGRTPRDLGDSGRPEAARRDRPPRRTDGLRHEPRREHRQRDRRGRRQGRRARQGRRRAPRSPDRRFGEAALRARHRPGRRIGSRCEGPHGEGAPGRGGGSVGRRAPPGRDGALRDERPAGARSVPGAAPVGDHDRRSAERARVEPGRRPRREHAAVDRVRAGPGRGALHAHALEGPRPDDAAGAGMGDLERAGGALARRTRGPAAARRPGGLVPGSDRSCGPPRRPVRPRDERGVRPGRRGGRDRAARPARRHTGRAPRRRPPLPSGSRRAVPREAHPGGPQPARRGVLSRRPFRVRRRDARRRDHGHRDRGIHRGRARSRSAGRTRSPRLAAASGSSTARPRRSGGSSRAGAAIPTGS